MTIFETLYLMLQTGIFLVSLLTLIILLIIYIGTKNEKK